MSTPMTQHPSPVIRLLDLVWGQTNTATGHSWERLNHAMRGALEVAIGAGFPFALDDVSYIATHYRFGYWSSDSPEWIYTASVRNANLSAAQSYEAWQGRKPFMMDHVEGANPYAYNPYKHGQARYQQRNRLTIGARFVWQGYRVTVTSFAADGQSLTVCSYKAQPPGASKVEIEKRFTITQADLKAARKERKEREGLIAILTQAATAQGSPALLLAALGVTSKPELDCLPLATLRTVAAQYTTTEEPVCP